MAQTKKPGCCRLRLLSLLTVVGVVAIANSNYASAQIVPDKTLGAENSTTRASTLNGLPADVIEGGARRGTSLFHSFSQFSVLTGQAAYFNNDIAIQNIISRVTGSSVSNIDGLIAANGTANVFLINPNGIIFGPNASLSIGGSFLASTANSLTFTDGSVFSATTPQASPLLTISVPIGLQYGSNPGSIAVQGSSLQVPAGQTLALVGGNVQLDGASLVTPGSRVELGGLAATGVIGVDASSNGLSLSFPEGVARGDVALTNGTEVNVRAGGGGSIAINAQNLDLTGGSKLRAGIASGMGAVGNQGGDIDINATGTVSLSDDSFIANVVQNNAVGNAGNTNITTGSMNLTNGAVVSASTYGQGDAGSVSITARDTVAFDGVDSNGNSSGAFSTVEQGAVGKGGGVTIITGSLNLTNGAEVNASTSGQGDAGSLSITARDNVSFDGVGSNGNSSGAASQVAEGAVGKGGNVTISTGLLKLTNGAELSARTYGQGDGGSVSITARDTVSFDGVGSNGFSSGAFSTVEQGAVGKGGGVSITTGSLNLTNGAVVNASTYGQGDGGSVSITARDTVAFDGDSSGAFSAVYLEAVGKGGGVSITTGSLNLTNGAVVNASTYGQGDGGSVFITARDTVAFDGVSRYRNSSGAISEVASGAVGKGGDVSIATGSLKLTDGAIVSASTYGQGDAGSVSITARDIVSFNGVDASNGNSSGAYSTVNAGAVGKGGDVTITTGSLNLTNGAVVDASTIGQGDAGSVSITAHDTVSFDGSNGGNSSGVSSVVYPGTVGKGGGVTISTGSLYFTNGADVNAGTYGQGDGGSISITARDTVAFDGVGSNGNSSGAFSQVAEGAVGKDGGVTISTGSLYLTNGAGVSATTYGQGDAGSVSVTARDTISFDGVGRTGFSSGVFSTVEQGAVGKGGDINITAHSLILTNGAALTTSSTGKGAAGNIQVQANDIGLNNRGLISSDTVAGQGNINLRSQFLVLQHGSDISTNATGSQVNGGNITLNNDFLIALENSDITANSQDFRGGNVNITTQGIFGTAFRPHLTPQSDITASGANSSLNGTVVITTPNVDPSHGIAALPAQVADASKQIAQGCAAGDGTTGSQFAVTGRGGLPPSPNEVLSGDAIWQDTRPGRIATQRQPSPSRKTSSPLPVEIVPATGWVFNSKGEVTLIGQTASASQSSLGSNHVSCSGR